VTDIGAVARRALGLLDLTDLSDGCTEHDVRRLCQRASTQFGRVAAVCVWPRFVSTAHDELGEEGIRIATVVNFPTGDEDVMTVVEETRDAIASGADEIDVVLPYRSVLAGDISHATGLLRAVREVATPPILVKVILETGELPSRNVVIDCARLAIDCGADFIKTSTGKKPVSATIDVVEAMLEVIHESRHHVGIKPSGGIKTLADAARYLEVADRIMGRDWVGPSTFRFGASGLLDGILDELS
jgi:deoxyribose-phosphate aldolase